MNDQHPMPHTQTDKDPEETQEWLDSLEYVLEAKGVDRAAYLFERLRDRLGVRGVQVRDAEEPGPRRRVPQQFGRAELVVEHDVRPRQALDRPYGDQPRMARSLADNEDLRVVTHRNLWPFPGRSA